MGKINQPTNLVDHIKDLKRQVSELRKRAGLGNADVGQRDVFLALVAAFGIPRGFAVAGKQDAHGLAGSIWCSATA